MKPLLNTVYVTNPESALRKDGENVVVEQGGAERLRVPLHMVGSIVAFGPALFTPALLMACASGGIPVGFCDRNGRFRARVHGPVAGNVLLRRAQYRIADEAAVHRDIVRAMLLGKISNQRQVLMRARRDLDEPDTSERARSLSDAARRLGRIGRALVRESDVDVLRGLEGDGARVYFESFQHLVRSTDEAFVWAGRSRRPPRDALNALLSFLYTLLTHDCASAAEAVGLDPAVGFLHRDRPGRPSLALDLMEELRPVLVDRLALSLVNRKQLQGRDFVREEGGAVLLSEEARRTVLRAWQERKRDARRHPFLEESAPLGLVPFLQAKLLARHIRGDLDCYPPWLWH